MPIPRAIDRYVVESVLGEGGMGRVYLAFDPRLGRRVALKVVLAEGSTARARAIVRARVMREARAAAAFNHPNVVAVYDVGEVDGDAYIAMEFVAGSTLRAIVAGRHVPEAQRLAWLVDVARGLAAAHRVGLVHRDVKPENVMITEQGVVKILDFGIARQAEDEAVDPTAPTFATLTAKGVTVGTPQYMSPEQLNSEPLDGRSDQFGWGVMAWEILAGQLPWGPKAGPQLITAVLTAPAPPLLDTVTSVEPRVSAAIGRALEKRADDRFASMEDLLAAIEGRPGVAASPASPARDVASRPVHLTGQGLAQPTPDVLRTTMRTGGRTALLAAGVLAVAGIAGGVLLARNAARDAGRGSSTGVAVDAAPPAAHALPVDVAPFFARADEDEREGKHDEACSEYRHASDAHQDSVDAALAAMLCYRNDAPGGRVYFRRAWLHRAGLSPRDAAVLDAYEPFFQRDPVDGHEEKIRLEAAVARFPKDAALHYYLAGSYRLDSVDGKRAIGEIERAIELDPLQPHVLAIDADFRSYDGDFAGAHATIERCLRAVPGAIECLNEEAWLDSEEGDCTRLEAAARRMLTIDPGYGAGARALANAVYAKGTTVDAVRGLLERARASDEAPLTAKLDAVHLAMLEGDFVQAEQAARKMADEARTSLVAADHGLPARLLAAIEHESGKDADAAAVAKTYLDGRDAWEPSPDFDDWAMSDEPTPLMLAARLRVGALSRGDYEAALAKTVERWTERSSPSTKNFVWIHAYADPAETRADAVLALAHLGEFTPVPRFKPLSVADESIGRVYLLAGRGDEAVAALERATHTCYPVDYPMEHTRAHYLLGTALEAKGDVAGACAAYRVVKERWGAAKPRSITLDAATARLAALHCAK